MWYYTYHTLELPSDEEHNSDMYEEKIDEIIGYTGTFDDRIKWYNQEKDMRKVSKMYPNVLFKIHWEWEEGWDLWDCYYLWWKMQRCEAKITYEKFDKKLLI